ncbi:HAMP domain-containing protein [bacterium]|nr:HAMP domain-containing protein [bacterium]
MTRMTQVCNVLIQNLAESVKGNLLSGKYEKVTEEVYKLRKTSIEGLTQVAILNHKGDLVESFDKGGEEVVLANTKELLNLTGFLRRETSTRFEFYYPVKSELQEEGQTRDIVVGVAFVSFSKRAILGPIEQARNIALGSAIVIVLLSILGIYIIASRLARQIQSLSEGAREVGKGNLDIEIAVRSNDELGQLAGEFNRMIMHLREKLHMQKFMSKLTMQMIKDTVGANGNNTKAHKRNVAVLFSDVRNFSTVAERLAPEQIVDLINIYFDLQTRTIEKNRGIVDKFMGDQIMAIFEGGDMADDALRAGVEIQKQIRQLNQTRAARGDVTLEMGIGINNGDIVMGRMGSADRMDYTVIGDVVNVASRLCASAKGGQIVTSFELTRKVTSSYPTTRLKSLSVKGRIQSIDVCEVDYDRDILM